MTPKQIQHARLFQNWNMESRTKLTITVIPRPSDGYRLFGWTWQHIIRFFIVFALWFVLFDTWLSPGSVLRTFSDWRPISAVVILLALLISLGLLLFPVLRARAAFQKS